MGERDFRRTRRDCPVCEAENAVLKDEKRTELFCYECYTVLDKHLRIEEEDDAWTQFRQYRRENYSGWHGPDRIKFIGGFAQPYDFDTDF